MDMSATMDNVKSSFNLKTQLQVKEKNVFYIFVL